MPMLWYLLMGHLVGDYLLQNSWMAYNKKVYNMPCLAHCAIYTFSVCLALHLCPEIDTVPISLMLWIFASHWILDRTEILDWWFNSLDVRSWNSIDANLEDSANIHHSVSIAFGALTYAIADNTLHFIMMWYLLSHYY